MVGRESKFKVWKVLSSREGTRITFVMTLGLEVQITVA